MTKEEKFLKVWNDPFLFAKNFITIVDKNGHKVPFEFNPVQKDFASSLNKYNVVLKSRQMGLSVCTCAIAIHKAITESYSTCLMLSHSEESCRAIFDKLKQMYSTIPSELKPKLLLNNRSELALANGSKISCTTMGKRDKGRGSTLALCHVSEFAFVNSETATKQLLGLEQAIQANGVLIVESTANGNNHYQDLYFKSKNNENAYKGYFYNYVDGACMFQDEYKEYSMIFRNINGHEFEEDDLTEEERQLFQDGVPINIICWRRLKIQNSSLDQFNQEYPYTDIDAFVTSGSSVFDKKIITNNRNRIKQSKVKVIDKPIDLNQKLADHYKKSLYCYEKPQINHKYIIGADISQGIGKDYHAFIVVDLNTKQEVAIFRNNKIRPDECADLLNVLGKYYNKALICVEKASGGIATIQRLYYELHYYNMVRYRSFDDYGKQIIQIGFSTDAKSKGLVINNLREKFEKGIIQINSDIILEEMSYYQCNNGKFGAISGRHDDTIMALALAADTLDKPKFYQF
ncbi:MAG: hypothetical protein AB9856_00955 [Cellulosilyticaceae bacterium]